MASYEERILKAIEDSKVGLTTVDVARKAGVSKTTAIKYLSVLNSEGKCEFVEVGPSKRWRSKTPKVEEKAEGPEMKDLEALEEALCGETPLPLSVVAQLKEISDDVTISMSFKVKPEKVGTFMKLMKKCVQQKNAQ